MDGKEEKQDEMYLERPKYLWGHYAAPGGTGSWGCKGNLGAAFRNLVCSGGLSFPGGQQGFRRM